MTSYTEAFTLQAVKRNGKALDHSRRYDSLAKMKRSLKNMRKHRFYSMFVMNEDMTLEILYDTKMKKVVEAFDMSSSIAGVPVTVNII